MSEKEEKAEIPLHITMPDQSQTNDESSKKSTTEGSDEKVDMDKESEQHVEFVTGYQLLTVVSSVTIVIFLMMLDLAIIVTVWQSQLRCYSPIANPRFRQFLILQVNFTPFLMWDGTVVPIY